MYSLHAYFFIISIIPLSWHFSDLQNPASIYELTMIAFELEESGWTEADGTKEDLASYVNTLLQSKASMLDDYFSIEIDDSGKICSLPYLLGLYAKF